MSDPDDLHTRVSGVLGRWPPLPSTWSFSSLREAEECPRRWMLTRASYPAIWEHRGYPPRPALSALVGDVLHRALESILVALQEHGCPSSSGPAAISALKDLGGYSEVIRLAIAATVDPLRGNPRLEGSLPHLQASLLRRLPEIRQRVQSMTSRLGAEAAPMTTSAIDHGHDRLPLTAGSHAEVELQAPDLRFTGRADLITLRASECVITDYKSGRDDPHHEEQLRIYALLWRHDVVLNPHSLPVTQLILAYPTHSETLAPPSAPELAALEQQLLERMQAADTSLKLRPPLAHPAPAICEHCSVRHLCDDYWVAQTKASWSKPVTDPIVDCAVTIDRQNGPRSWLVTLDPTAATALLQTATENVAFSAGQRLRLLAVVVDRDEESETPTLRLTNSSEYFSLL